jgi:DNA-binding MarR family transcriptional regulator
MNGATMFDPIEPGGSQAAVPPALVEQIAATVADPRLWPSLSGLLRAVARPLLDATLTMRHEPIEPYERTLAFAARRFTTVVGDDPIHADPRYVLGRIEALLDLCDMGIDRSVSEEVVARARGRKHVRTILDHLVRVRECKASDLAHAVGITPNHLSNLLSWMEAADLIRRAASGRLTLVSLGPKGEAVQLALAGETGHEGTDRRAAAPATAAPRTAREYQLDIELTPGIDGGDEIPLGVDDNQVETVAA